MELKATTRVQKSPSTIILLRIHSMELKVYTFNSHTFHQLRIHSMELKGRHQPCSLEVSLASNPFNGIERCLFYCNLHYQA